MKKLLLILALLIPTTLFADVDYYDLQHYKVVPDTTTNRNDWYMRGSFHIVKSSTIPDVSACPIVLSFRDDGVIVGSISTATFADTCSTSTWSLDSDLLDGNDSLYYAIKADVASSTNTLQSNLDTEIAIRINEIASLPTTYLALDGIADDSSLWKTMDIDTTTLVVNDLLRWDGTDLVRVASGTAEGSYLKQDFSWDIPVGAGDMSRSVYDIGTNNIVDNSEALNGESYAHFVTTTTDQTIGGKKTFEDETTISSHTNITGNLTVGDLVSGNVKAKRFTVPMCRVIGATGNEEGFLIDDAAERCGTSFILPDDLTQIDMIRIGGITKAPTGAGDGMNIDILIRAGTDNESRAAHNITLSDYNSISLNYLINEMIFWEIPYAELGGMQSATAGDRVHMYVAYVVGSGDGDTTNAMISEVEIEYQ